MGFCQVCDLPSPRGQRATPKNLLMSEISFAWFEDTLVTIVLNPMAIKVKRQAAKLCGGVGMQHLKIEAYGIVLRKL